ncbi:MAG: hypothetical protein A2X11_01155 [Bacteroidetes bacterium GWE2_42_24]|nr:MAG: hypothetical protein A2X11_01155 [Bacteroidetes bacterium GWE2_42_24]OFY27306.1 MAG: hypothetical protein A2X09_00365 [Bacteroidetes bacterium GWF2_43_11]
MQASTQTNRDRKKLEQEKIKIEEEIKSLKKMLDATSTNHMESIARFQILTNTISKRQQLIENINSNIKGLDGQIKVLVNEVKRLSREHESLRKDYAHMIRAAYANRGRYSKIMFLLASSDFNQAYLRLRYYQQYSEFRKRQAQQIETTQHVLTQRKSTLDSTRARQLEGRQELSNEKTKLQQEQTQQDKLVKSLGAKKTNLEKDIKKKQIAAEKLKKTIEKVIAEEIRLAAERAKKSKSGEKAKPKTDEKSGVFELTPAEQTLAKNFTENRGRLPWPVERGYVVEEYGEHPHPVTRTVKTKNNGIDILSPGNSSAKAIFEGIVSRVIEVPGYNHVVIIRHGSFLSVYSNLLSVNVNVDENVSKGSVIGVIAPDASEKNSMIHFELWRGTTSVNPSEWLLRR